MDASIILGGQAPDIVGALERGRAAAENQITLNRQNELARIYREQGAGIMAGNPQSLNALAQIDPQAAMGMQAQRQEMTFDAERMQMARDEGKRRTQEALATQGAQVTADAIAREREQIARGLSGAAFFYQNKDERGYNAFLAQAGLDPAQFPFASFPAHAAMFEGALEALTAFAPQPENTTDRYKVVGDSLFDLQAEGGPAPIGQGAMQETVVMGPDGKPIMVQGGPGTGAKFTEGQSKDNVYATRAEGALSTFEPVSDAMASYTGAAAEAVPFNLGKPMQSEGYQLARQAGLEFLASVLRKDTGAAVTASEEEMYGRIFLPQPGDKPAVLEQKRIARIRAVEAIKAGMNADQIAAMGRALTATEQRANPDAPAAVQPPAQTKQGEKRAADMSDDEFLKTLGFEN